VLGPHKRKGNRTNLATYAGKTILSNLLEGVNLSHIKASDMKVSLHRLGDSKKASLIIGGTVINTHPLDAKIYRVLDPKELQEGINEVLSKFKML
jgi:hypothetical protein